MEQLDMRGQPCPIPMVEARKNLEQAGVDGLAVLVDNLVATQNLEKMARGLGYGYTCRAEGDSCFCVTLRKAGDAPPDGGAAVTARSAPAGGASLGGGPSLGGVSLGEPSLGAAAEGVTVLVTGDALGRGDDALGKILIKGFLYALTELSPVPKAVIFLNGGARLTSEGANTVADLKTLEEKGCEVLTCGTCISFYGIADALAVGAVTDMMGIASRLAAAARLITL